MLDLLLLSALLQLRLDLLERRRGQRTGVFEEDDVVTEIGLDRGLGQLTLLQLDQRLGERLGVGIRRIPAEVAAVVLGTGILRLLGQFGELFALVELDDDRLGVVFVGDQDVLGLVFGRAEVGLDRVVTLAQLVVADRVGAHVIRQVNLDQHGLPGEFDLALDLGALVETLLLGFLDEDFAADQLFLDGILQLRRIRRALSLLLGDEGVVGVLGNGLAVDGGHGAALLGESRGGSEDAGHEHGGQMGDFDHSVFLGCGEKKPDDYTSSGEKARMLSAWM